MSVDKVTPEDRFDRHLPIGASVTGEPVKEVRRKFLEGRVLITGSPSRLKTSTGRMMFLVSANLIARFCPRIDLCIPEELIELAKETLIFLEAIDNSSEANFQLIAEPEPGNYSAVLSVGKTTVRSSRVTSIDAEGWLASVGSGGALTKMGIAGTQNPFGGLVAAALGAAEVFKYLLEPKPGKAGYFGTTTFSAWNYSIGENDPGPELPLAVDLPRCLLAGVGAVGNAFLLSLSHVSGARGEFIVNDREYLDDPTNLNRYSLALERDVRQVPPLPKTILAQRVLAGTGVQVNPFPEPLEETLDRIYRREVPRPTVVLSAVDNNLARGSLQRLWPDLLLEGATDSTVSQVSRHEYARGMACLLCIHSQTRTTPGSSYVQTVADASGLPEEVVAASLRDPLMVLREEHVVAAGESSDEFLKPRIGKPICSVLSEIENLSNKKEGDLPVQPAVSFVSMMSGVLMAGELIKYATNLGTGLETFYQADLMFPLSNSFLQPVEKVMRCECVIRRHEIRVYRESTRSEGRNEAAESPPGLAARKG